MTTWDAQPNGCSENATLRPRPSVSPFSKFWRKLRDASWDELRVRGGQELGRRSDALRYRLHLPFPTTISSVQPARLPVFFFPPGDARSVIEVITDILPEQPKDWIARA